MDIPQLENAVLNLCINARDAMPSGGRLTLEASNARIDQGYADLHADVAPGQYVLISVSDTGCGIAPEHLDRVFDPFFTTKEVGKGTGLGLSMVYGFVKQSNGHLQIYSELGQRHIGENLLAQVGRNWRRDRTENLERTRRTARQRNDPGCRG